MAGPSQRSGRRQDIDELDVEQQRCIGRNHIARTARAVAGRGWNDQSSYATGLHAGDTEVPAADHVAPTELEGEGLPASPAAVELLAFAVLRGRVLQPAGVMHVHTRAVEGDRAVPDF